MSLEIHGLDLRLAKKMLFTGVNLRIDKPNLVVYVIDEAGSFIEGADVSIVSAGHDLSSITDSFGMALTRFMPAINNTLTVSKEGYATSSQVIFNEMSSTLSVYVRLFASEIRLKVVNNQNEPIEGATCRVLYAIGGSNNVLSFDGVDDYVQLPAAVAALLTETSATLELMVKLNLNTPNPNTKSGFAGFTTATDNAHYPWTDNNLYINTFRNNRLTCGNNLAFNKTAWHRVTITTTPGTNGWKIYQNGNLFHQNTGLAAVYVNSNQLFIGKSHGNFWLNGYISDIRLWKKALNSTEINDLKYTRLIGNETDLVGYWDFADGNGTTVIDKVNGNNGTIYGATWAEADESFPLPVGITGYDTETPYDSQTTNANGLTTLNYQINPIHGLEVTLPGRRRFIMPFRQDERQILNWQVMLSDIIATFITSEGDVLINAEPENNDSNFLIS